MTPRDAARDAVPRKQLRPQGTSADARELILEGDVVRQPQVRRVLVLEQIEGLALKTRHVGVRVLEQLAMAGCRLSSQTANCTNLEPVGSFSKSNPHQRSLSFNASRARTRMDAVVRAVRLLGQAQRVPLVQELLPYGSFIRLLWISSSDDVILKAAQDKRAGSQATTNRCTRAILLVGSFERGVEAVHTKQ